MKESIANSYVFTLCLVFVGILIVILITSIGYTKTFKVKNRIIDILSTAGKDAVVDIDGQYARLNPDVKTEIETVLRDAGYRINTGYNASNPYNLDAPGCKKAKEGSLVGKNYKTIVTSDSAFVYCAFKVESSRGYYFNITVFTTYDIPLIGTLEFPLVGESRLIHDL